MFTLSNMRKRDQFLKIFRSQSPGPCSPQLSGSTVLPAAHSSVPSPVPAQSSLAVSTSATAHRNLALELAIQRHIDKLPEPDRDAFRAASKNINEYDLLAQSQEWDAQHALDSSFRPQAERLSKLLRLLDRFMGGIAIGIQANPDLSAIIIGGIRIVIDLAIHFVEFFPKLADMLCQFEDYLEPLAKLAENCQDSSLIQKSLTNTYADILEFCQKARTVFVDSYGARRKWTSWRLFLRQQWEPFETEFGTTKTRMQHHVDVLRLAGQAQQLSNDQRKEREEFLRWLSPIDFEEAHDSIYSKKHPGTGEWLIRTDKFQDWVNSSVSALPWCYGKRE
jgi:hypothetical protein